MRVMTHLLGKSDETDREMYVREVEKYAQSKKFFWDLQRNKASKTELEDNLWSPAIRDQTGSYAPDKLGPLRADAYGLVASQCKMRKNGTLSHYEMWRVRLDEDTLTVDQKLEYLLGKRNNYATWLFHEAYTNETYADLQQQYPELTTAKTEKE